MKVLRSLLLTTVCAITWGGAVQGQAYDPTGISVSSFKVPSRLQCFFGEQCRGNDPAVCLKDCVKLPMETYRQCNSACYTSPLSQSSQTRFILQTNCLLSCLDTTYNGSTFSPSAFFANGQNQADAKNAAATQTTTSHPSTTTQSHSTSSAYLTQSHSTKSARPTPSSLSSDNAAQPIPFTWAGLGMGLSSLIAMQIIL
ncbi:hypothetical protein IWQ62_003264 [Dispira parvispora]|uniref:Uncharacterized protein n=1 Tax=Dispira parvispora TaxID=1520584 RepID=A0A9W8E325_9FUNG|nr:hypothetical protein IWQ62_003264 [Dispira parvispora]